MFPFFLPFNTTSTVQYVAETAGLSEFHATVALVSVGLSLLLLTSCTTAVNDDVESSPRHLYLSVYVDGNHAMCDRYTFGDDGDLLSDQDELLSLEDESLDFSPLNEAAGEFAMNVYAQHDEDMSSSSSSLSSSSLSSSSLSSSSLSSSSGNLGSLDRQYN